MFRGSVLARAALLAGAAFSLIAPAAAEPRLWVLDSPSQFRLPPPPDADTTRTELQALRAMMAQRDAAATQRMAWWEAVAPSYRWQQVALAESMREGLPVNIASRRLALLHTAIADALRAAQDSQAAHGRARPDGAPGASYPDTHAVAAGVAGAVLADLFPRRAEAMTRLAEEAGRARLLAGVAYPSDVAAGLALGRQVAAVAIARGRADRTTLPWSGTAPTGPGVWTGTPALPQAAGWRPWLLDRPDALRPAAPDDAAMQAELQQVRAAPRTPITSERARFWEYGAGGLRVHEFWNGHAQRLLLESGKAQDAMESARILALVNVALYDAGIACWDAKYAHWAMRPAQRDPSLQTLVPAPSHPSFPSAHSCFSFAAAGVLAAAFPADAEELTGMAREAGEARIWAGIHYPMDVVAGQRIGEQVAERAIHR